MCENILMYRYTYIMMYYATYIIMYVHLKGDAAGGIFTYNVASAAITHLAFLVVRHISRKPHNQYEMMKGESDEYRKTVKLFRNVST